MSHSYTHDTTSSWHHVTTQAVSSTPTTVDIDDAVPVTPAHLRQRLTSKSVSQLSTASTTHNHIRHLDVPPRRSVDASRSVLSYLTQDDAYLHQSWESMFRFSEFKSIDMWRAGILEGIGTLLFVWMNVAAIIGVGRAGYAHPEVITGAMTGVLIAAFILALAPASGGHFSTLITATAFTTKLVSFPRCIVYLVCQTVGAILGALLIGATTGSLANLPVCAFDTAKVSVGAAFLHEFMISWIFVFLVWYCVLDTRQGTLVWGGLGIVGPGLVGVVVWIIIVVSGGGVADGMGFAGVNPARCIALSMVTGKATGRVLFVYAVAPLLAAAVHGMVYLLIPPYHTHYYRLKRQWRHEARHAHRRTQHDEWVEMEGSVGDVKPRTAPATPPPRIVVEMEP